MNKILLTTYLLLSLLFASCIYESRTDYMNPNVDQSMPIRIDIMDATQLFVGDNAAQINTNNTPTSLMKYTRADKVLPVLMYYRDGSVQAINSKNTITYGNITNEWVAIYSNFDQVNTGKYQPLLVSRRDGRIIAFDDTLSQLTNKNAFKNAKLLQRNREQNHIPYNINLHQLKLEKFNAKTSKVLTSNSLTDTHHYYTLEKNRYLYAQHNQDAVLKVDDENYIILNQEINLSALQTQTPTSSYAVDRAKLKFFADNKGKLYTSGVMYTGTQSKFFVASVAIDTEKMTATCTQAIEYTDQTASQHQYLHTYPIAREWNKMKLIFLTDNNKLLIFDTQAHTLTAQSVDLPIGIANSADKPYLYGTENYLIVPSDDGTQIHTIDLIGYKTNIYTLPATTSMLHNSLSTSYYQNHISYVAISSNKIQIIEQSLSNGTPKIIHQQETKELINNTTTWVERLD